MPFKHISYLKRWHPACLAEQNHLGNFGRGHFEEHFFKIILHLDQGFTYDIEGGLWVSDGSKGLSLPHPVQVPW